MGRKTFFLAKQQKHLQSTPLAEPIRTVYVLAMCAHFFAMFCWSQKKRLSTRRAGPGPYQEIRLVVGSPGRATGDITFVEDAGVEREGCLACFLGHLVQKGVIDKGGVVVHPVQDLLEVADGAGRRLPRGERSDSLGPPGDN